MASFFRRRIANKVILILTKKTTNGNLQRPSLVSTFVQVSKLRGEPPQLFIPWRKITDLSQTDTIVNPTELVRQLRNQGLPTAEGITDITLIQEPLGVVFTVDKHIFSKIVLTEICSEDENIIKHSCYFQDIPRKNILLECKVPNIGEDFQMTHFRSAIHCNFITNINKMAGHNVIKTRHVADWGFSSAALLTGYKEFGIENELLKNPSQHLSEVLKAAKSQYGNDLSFRNKVNLCFENLEKGDQIAISDWLHLRDFCLKQHDSIYNKIGLTFDDSHFDSSYSSEIKEIGNNLRNRDLISTQEDGKVKLNITTTSGVENYLKSENIDSEVYNLSRAIYSAVNMKKKHNFDIMLYVAPTSGKHFLSLLFPLLEELGFEWAGCLQHVKLKNVSHFIGKGKKMLDVENTLKQAKKNILNKLNMDLSLEIDDNLEDMAEALSYVSLAVYDMKHRRNVDYAFNWNDVLSFGKNSGALLQYCHAGLKGLQGESSCKLKLDIDTSPLLEPEAHDLVQHLARFDEMVYKSYLTLEPCILLQYLFSLWYLTDKATNVLKLDIKGERIVVIRARLLLLSATLKVLQTGLCLLGITPYENKYSPPDFIKS